MPWSTVDWDLFEKMSSHVTFDGDKQEKARIRAENVIE